MHSNTMKPSGVLCIALVLLLMQYNALAQTTTFSIEENGPRNEVVGRVVESGGADLRWVVEPVKLMIIDKYIGYSQFFVWLCMS